MYNNLGRIGNWLWSVLRHFPRISWECLKNTLAMIAGILAKIGTWSANHIITLFGLIISQAH